MQEDLPAVVPESVEVGVHRQDLRQLKSRLLIMNALLALLRMGGEHREHEDGEHRSGCNIVRMVNEQRNGKSGIMVDENTRNYLKLLFTQFDKSSKLSEQVTVILLSSDYCFLEEHERLKNIIEGVNLSCNVF